MDGLNGMAFLANAFCLYGNDGYDSHVVRFLLHCKDLKHRFVWTGAADDELARLNPYGTLPILVGRDVTLYEINVIFEYLEERHRAYQLLPASPKDRAFVRTLAWRIQKDWLALGKTLLAAKENPSDAAHHAQKALSDTLITLAPLFAKKAYFLSDTLGWCDVLLAPFLWRLEAMGIALPPRLCRPLIDYQQRLFADRRFIASLAPEDGADFQENDDDDF